MLSCHMLLDISVNTAWRLMLAPSTSVPQSIKRKSHAQRTHTLHGMARTGLQVLGKQGYCCENNWLCLHHRPETQGGCSVFKWGSWAFQSVPWLATGQRLSWLVCCKDWERLAQTAASTAKMSPVVPGQAGWGLVLWEEAWWGPCACFLHHCSCVSKWKDV